MVLIKDLEKDKTWNVDFNALKSCLMELIVRYKNNVVSPPVE